MVEPDLLVALMVEHLAWLEMHPCNAFFLLFLDDFMDFLQFFLDSSLCRSVAVVSRCARSLDHILTQPFVGNVTIVAAQHN